MENGRIKNIKRQILSDNWYTLNKYTFEYQKFDGSWEVQKRESYDCGDGAAVLLYNTRKGTVVLTRQFRMPTYVNENTDGMMVEVCAGLLDGLTPKECILKEILEETGYQLTEVKQVLVTYMCPGSVTQKLYLFIGEYQDAMKVESGGGADDETENIEVLEMPFENALQMMVSGAIRDAKTVMLLQYAQINKLIEVNS
ncbi:NUDIX domain-containing protein [Maribacter algicola]|uniref:GDP-mannose pyrophosphatase n=1 Tax=Maribacter algicola TaxID=2498892 RepID=A0A426RGT1_9FLAO|nr:NUDIX domain-containing protein [Maribacter algicola]RRQ48099.1 NUDIX domain-containing protein [Maribacter algicola]